MVAITIIIMTLLGDALASSEAAWFLPLQINSQEEVSCSHHNSMLSQSTLLRPLLFVLVAASSSFQSQSQTEWRKLEYEGELLCVISRKLLSQFVIMSRHLPHHNDYRKLKVHHPNPHHHEPTQVRCDEPPQSLLAAGWKAPCPRNRSSFILEWTKLYIIWNKQNYTLFEIGKIMYYS